MGPILLVDFGYCACLKFIYVKQKIITIEKIDHKIVQNNAISVKIYKVREEEYAEIF